MLALTVKIRKSQDFLAPISGSPGDQIFMPPTSKKLEGHIASGTFVRASVRASVRYAF